MSGKNKPDMGEIMEAIFGSVSRVLHRGRFRAAGAILFTAVAAILLVSSAAFATEGGGSVYAGGNEDFMSGALPPPGFYFINYTNYYWADRFNDGHGNSVVPGFRVSAVVDALRFIYVTNVKILGLDYGMHAIVPIVNLNVHVPGQKKSITEVGDVTFDPLVLAWHSKNLHAVAGLDINLPVGGYDVTSIANAGRNYWNLEPALAFTYLSDGGFEASSKFMYDFNFKNDKTEYLSGEEFHFDYTIAYHIKNWGLGVGGFYYKQTTDDKQYGLKVGLDGLKGQAFAIGPQVKYDYKNMSFILKYQKEMAVENRPEGDKLWFKFIYAFK